MSKRKRQHHEHSRKKSRRVRQATNRLQSVFARADNLIERGRAWEALELLEPLLTSYPDVADLHYTIGRAHLAVGDTWGGLAGHERALELSRDPGYWLPLALLYLDVDLDIHALYAFRQALKLQPGIPRVDVVRETIESLEREVLQAADSLELPVAQAERGLRLFEEGQRALSENNFSACISASKQAIRLLGDWPPPRNNLSLALFFDGQPEKAISTARQVFAHAPDSAHAFSNIVRFLAWTGRREEAQALWPQQEEITLRGDVERLMTAEAAAILGKDESVYDLLKPLDEPSAAQETASGLANQVQRFLATAEANTGRRVAPRRLKALQQDVRWAGEFLAALKAGRPGPGWAERFPYFHATDLLPGPRMMELVELMSREEEMSPQEFRDQVTDLTTRFPQIVLVAEKLIWEENQPDAGIATLAAIGTPAAHAALRRFGLSRAGEDQMRMQALFSLMHAGEITQGETLHVWGGGEWRDVEIRQQEIIDAPDTQYSQKVADLLNRGARACQQGNDEQAEPLFRRAIALDARAKEGYNNLGAIHGRRKERDRAKEMFRRALELDPMYVFPRCNLAVYLLDEGDVKGAEAILMPLVDATRFHPQETAFYSYARGRLLILQGEQDAARQALQTALEVYPGYHLAESLLEQLDTDEYLREKLIFGAYREEQRRRDKRRRERLQTKLRTEAPTLAKALPLYTKNDLAGIAGVIVRSDGWSTLRKAELTEQIIAELSDPHNLERVVGDLPEEDVAALWQVLEEGGAMRWEDFDAGFGNDLDEPPRWRWQEPETAMGSLRSRGLLVEATVDGELLVAVPSDLRQPLREILA